MEHCIVYFSNWKAPFREEDLINTLERSRQQNAVDGITSVTPYVRGSIIQVLEGEKELVEALYEKIEKDSQHTNVIKVLSRPIQERLFVGTTMAYETMTTSQLQELENVIDFDNSQESKSTFKEAFILKLIKVFYETNRFN